MTVIDLRAVDASHSPDWTSACPVDRLVPGRGAAVLLRGGRQAALFRLSDGASEATGSRQGMLYAVGNIDPFGRAAVMSRGLVGDRGGEPTVASPLLKQVFSLLDGRCLDDDSVALPVYDVRVRNGMVEVGSHTREMSAKAS
ncbi:MAG TPA: nitrite reductase small subunit NirD [Aldersonia sp.]